MNVDSILISDYAAMGGGKLTVVGVFNRIGPVPLPVQLPHMAISLVIHGHPSEAGSHHAGEVRLINARRDILSTMPFDFTFANSGLIAGLPIRYIGIQFILLPVFEEAGPYAFEVFVDDTYHATASFAVVGPQE